MKKIIAIITFIFAGATSFAQKSYQHDDDYKNPSVYSHNDRGRYDRDDRYNRNYNTNFSRQRNIEIARINQEFNNKVRSIENNFWLSRRQKNRRIQQAQFEKEQQLQRVYNQYNGYNNQAGRYNNRNRGWQ